MKNRLRAFARSAVLNPLRFIVSHTTQTRSKKEELTSQANVS